MAAPSLDLSSYSDSSQPWVRETPLWSTIPWQTPSQSSNLPSPFLGVFSERLHLSFAQIGLPSISALWEHRITYCSHRTEGQLYGELGPGWFLADLPFLIKDRSSLSNKAQISIIGSIGCKYICQDDGQGGWSPINEARFLFEHDTVDRSFNFTADGAVAVSFHSFDSSLPRQLRGKLKSIHSLSEDTSIYSEYGVHNFPDKITLIHDGQRDLLIYEPTLEPGVGQRLATVTHHSSQGPRNRICYQYSSFRKKTVPLLKGFNLEIWNDGHWVIQKRAIFRYKSASSQLHEIKVWDTQFSQDGSISPRTDESQMTMSMAHYEIHADLLGNVFWIRHTGVGPEPSFFD